MISVGTILKVIDNSGAKYVRCIKILNIGGRRYGKPGEKMVVSVQSVNPAKKIRKGEVCKAIIVRTKKEIIRRDGMGVRFDDNAAVLINKKDGPYGTRVLSAVMQELRSHNYMKIISLATITI